jgi:hypothetical protein
VITERDGGAIWMMAHVDECTVLDPDECFSCKLTYWRENGTPAVRYVGGQKRFHETTIPAEQRKIVAEAKRKGNEAIPVTNWV